MRAETLHIDFAPGARRVSWAGRLLLLASVALLAAGLRQGAQLLAEQARARDALRAVEARHVGDAAATAAPLKADPRQLALVRATRVVASDLTIPWASLLASLGSAPSRDVALLSVEPSAIKRSVRLTAEARDARAMLDYVGALQRDTRLSSVVLVSHQVQAQAPGAPIRFQVQAQWGDPR